MELLLLLSIIAIPLSGGLYIRCLWRRQKEAEQLREARAYTNLQPVQRSVTGCGRRL